MEVKGHQRCIIHYWKEVKGVNIGKSHNHLANGSLSVIFFKFLSDLQVTLPSLGISQIIFPTLLSGSTIPYKKEKQIVFADIWNWHKLCDWLNCQIQSRNKRSKSWFPHCSEEKCPLSEPLPTSCSHALSYSDLTNAYTHMLIHCLYS